MQLNNLLAVGIEVFSEGFGSVSLNWIGKIIRGIISFAGDIGLGIILFTVVLKLITLGPDIWSRVSSKKNALKMELMKDDLEKLQKQYANNPQLYQQKMMALYKKNGYSAFSACLPSIITLVVFIFVINAFTTYSNLMNKTVYNDMGIAYTEKVQEYAEEGVLVQDAANKEYYNIDINGLLKANGDDVYFSAGYMEGVHVTSEEGYKIDPSKYGEIKEKYPALKAYFTDDNTFNKENEELLRETDKYFRDKLKDLIIKIDDGEDKLREKGLLKADGDIADVYRVFEEYKDDARVNKYYDYEKEEIKYSEVFASAEFEKFEEEFISKAEEYVGKKAITLISEEKMAEIRGAARKAAEDKFKTTRDNKSYITPWIKNIWVADSPMNSAIPTDKNIISSLGKNVGTLTSENYAEITANLEEYKQTGFKYGNGWLILIALSIGTMFATQFIMQKMQKTQMQLSSVDGANGQAAMTQKMMTWMMPIMFGIFAFLYSASFSIYMITSSLFSLVSTLLINYFVEKKFKNDIKKEAEEKNATARYGKRRDK